MSRWLQSVNTLLENLDGQVSTAVQEAASEQQQHQGSHSRAVQSVLERRGLVLQADDDDDEDVSSSRGSSNPRDDDGSDEDGSYESSWDQDEWDNDDDEEESYSEEESYREGEEYNEDEDDDEEVIELLSNNNEEEATATTNRTNAPLFRDDSSVNEEEEEAALSSSVPAAGMSTERSIVDTSHDTIPPPESPNEVPGLDHEKTTPDSPAPTTMIVDPPSPSRTCDNILMPTPMTTATTTPTATATAVTTVSDVPENNSHTNTVAAAATMVVEPKQQTEAPAAILLTTATSQESDVTTKSHAAPPLSGNHSVQSISSSVANNNNNNNTAVVGQASQGGVMDQQQQQQLWVKKEHKWNKEAKKVQGEVRTLRGHVLKLNEQLEAAETELTAQRQELVRAAERMEKDRTRHRDQTDEMADDHDEELEAQKAEYTSLLQESKERHHQQLTELRDRLALVEERKAREDGNWTKELEEAVARERDAIQHKTELQNENAEWESKWNQAMQREAALNRKLENETIRGQTAEERERDAQDKLDASLSIHARQLSQKQARESELERTVADLGAALVVARQRELDRLSTNNQRRRRRPPASQQHSNKQSTNDDDNDNENDDNEYGDEEEDGMSVRERCAAAEEQVETLEAQLALEVQRSETLNQELQDMSKEQAQEAVFAQERQRKHDQQVQDLQSTVTRLQATVRDLQKRSSNEEMNDHPDGSANNDSGTGDMATSKEQERLRKQVKSLSEQIVRQQGKLDNGNCEALALRSRLKTALSRAETAEKALVTASSTRDVELGSSSSSNTHRSRYKGGGRASTRTTLVQSIRSVLPSQFVNQHEAVGETMDALDSFAIDMGAVLRQNPLARGGFLLYLLLLHMWTFCLILFHTGETPCYDTLPHGPDALFQHHSYRQLEQVHGNPTP